MEEHRCFKNETIEIIYRDDLGDLAGWTLRSKLDYAMDKSGRTSFTIQYCPFCGEKLPDQPEYEDGFYVVKWNTYMGEGCIFDSKDRTVLRYHALSWFNTNGNEEDLENFTVLRKIDLES